MSEDLPVQEPDLTEKFAIMHGWLVVEVDGCTCDGGGEFPHRPECGYEPVIQLADLAHVIQRHRDDRRVLVQLPEPDARRDVSGLVDVEWHDPRHGRHWLVMATRHADGDTEVSNGGVVITPDHAEARGLMLIAAAREARRLASGSGVGDQHGP